ncbi:sensor histidine kinase [Glycomyces tenuis]|uniref:sensor histidine kinase n=1 Tax=Glycomyces tenuis TaxID=58116 RepID=UPI0003F8B481|nr:HAMP domain-containing sensor histidine kinase [Glycomyces tenuis]
MRLRTRLTLWYSGAFFAAGAVLITVVYLLVSERLRSGGEMNVLLGGAGGEIEVRELTEADTDERLALAEEMTRRQETVNTETLEALLTWSAIALLAVGLLALAVGWLLAGRALRPIDAITSTARRVADRSLHERITLQGPNDELKRLADTFDEMLARLDRAFEGQRRFVANASHELRTPLAINRTLIEVAAAGPGADQRLKTLAENLLAVNARHERLIDGLLTLARTEHASPEPVPVDLADVVSHAADGLAREAADAEVVVRLDAAEAVTAGDATLLERLVENLIANAIRHNHAGGQVTAVTAVRDGKAVLSVSNTGPVVPPYEVDALFEPFRRGQGRDRVDSSGGVGLGLSIVASVARAHGAELEAAPRSGGGLRVSVAFPAAGPFSR